MKVPGQESHAQYLASISLWGQGRQEIADGDSKVLNSYLGEAAPTGDEFMEKVGRLCGSTSRAHWIDLVGINARKIDHSWHTKIPVVPQGRYCFGYP
jgi:hypothetical protein